MYDIQVDTLPNRISREVAHQSKKDYNASDLSSVIPVKVPDALTQTVDNTNSNS
jgi:hypothetical protein